MIWMTALYVLNILMCGVAANWSSELSGKNVDLANVEYVFD